MSGGGSCVEVAPLDGMVAVRHSRRPNNEMIIYNMVEWAAFLDGAKKGEFDDLACESAYRDGNNALACSPETFFSARAGMSSLAVERVLDAENW
jgi:hypothetical protein